ncbi:penicillin-binding protein [Nocardia sp. NBC_01499]|uniref:transglycosylase domain-containing protein n=1 Tax=Nocardia sp. NBC_01499 TaxID=2903597 RepID=UPI00386360F3
METQAVTSPYDDGPNNGRPPRGRQPGPGGYPPPRPSGPPQGARPMPPLRQGPGPVPPGGVRPSGAPPYRGPAPQGADPRGPVPPPRQRPGPGAPNTQVPQRRVPANLGEAPAQRNQRSGKATRPNGPGGPRPAVTRSRWRTIRRVLYILLALVIIVPCAAFVVAYNMATVPRPSALKTNLVATIVASDGKTVLNKVVPPQGDRTDVSIDQIPPHVRNAVIAIEDRTFYTNPGFSIPGFGRALRDNLLNREDAGGGSTITQQYVKNAYVGNEHALGRKWRELVISAKMARQWSKDDILTAYLNTIYFGRGANGINAAAKAYFNKKVPDLTPAEGAMLAALPREPSNLDPEKNRKGAESRWNDVLDAMVDTGAMTKADRAKMQFPQVVPAAQSSADKSDQGPNGLIKRQVIAELADAGISESQLNAQGLQITTTIDNKTQQAAVDAVQKNMPGERPETRTAVVSVDPKSGAVKAYYGGDNGQGWDFADHPLQTGSTFKVFGLAENLDLGIPLSKMYDSSDLTAPGTTKKITNAEPGETCGTCTIAEALRLSLNTSFYRMELDMGSGGPNKIAAMAHKAGIPDTIPDLGKTLVEPDGSPPNTGIILGQYSVRVHDMASAYATFAASGVYHKPHLVQRVVAADGQVLLDRGSVAGEQRVSKAVADNVTAAMEPIAASSLKHGLAGGRRSGAKTGTTQLGDTGQNKDAWMVGFTPSLSTAVWVGTPDGTALETSKGNVMWGSGLPSDIWKDTMDAALQGTPNEDFPKPASIGGQPGGVPSVSVSPSAPPPAPTTGTQDCGQPIPMLPPSFFNPCAPQQPQDSGRSPG